MSDSADQKPTKVVDVEHEWPAAGVFQHASLCRRATQLADEIQSVAMIAQLEIDLCAAAGEGQQPTALATGGSGADLLERRVRVPDINVGRRVGNEDCQLAVEVAGSDRGICATTRTSSGTGSTSAARRRNPATSSSSPTDRDWSMASSSMPALLTRPAGASGTPRS